MLAELKGRNKYYAIKCLKKDVILEGDDMECAFIERRIFILGTECPFLTKLYGSFQSSVIYKQFTYFYFPPTARHGGPIKHLTLYTRARFAATERT